MLMFTLTISCLITSNLPWFMDLTFQVPMQYCSLQHRTLLPSPVTSTTGCCFCFDSVSSSFLELFLHWAPVVYWAPTDLGSSSFSVLSFWLFILFMGFSRQEYWNGLPFPSPVDHILSGLSTMTCPSWVACLQGMAHSFIELDKAEPTKSHGYYLLSPPNLPFFPLYWFLPHSPSINHSEVIPILKQTKSLSTFQYPCLSSFHSREPWTSCLHWLPLLPPHLCSPSSLWWIYATSVHGICSCQGPRQPQ